MDADQFYTLHSPESLYRFNRIANSFSRRKDGPFRADGLYKIDVFSDDSDYLGSVEFIEYINRLYYSKVVASPICFGLDEVFMNEFYKCIRLLFWLDTVWSRPTFIRCPICMGEIDISDGMIDVKSSDYESGLVYRMLVGHVELAHPNIGVHGLKEDALRVFLKTTIGNFEIDNFYCY